MKRSLKSNASSGTKFLQQSPEEALEKELSGELRVFVKYLFLRLLRTLQKFCT